MPNRLQVIGQDMDFTFAADKVMKVTLNQDMSATAILDGGQKVNGNWFAFYDQAFKVELENGQRFISNYKYAIKPYVSTDPVKMGRHRIAQQNVQTDDYDKFFS